MILPPGYKCRLSAQAALIRVYIADILACFPEDAEIVDIAAEATVCSTLDQLIDIYSREVNQALCSLAQGTGSVIPSDGQDVVLDQITFNDNLFIYNAFAKSFSFPTLTVCNQGLYFSFDDTLGGNMSFLTTISLPVLTSINATLFCVRQPNLVSLSAPLLSSVGTTINIWDNTVLNTVNLVSLATLGGDFIAAGTTLTGLNLPNLTSWAGTTWDCSGNSIPTADVNALLVKFDSFGVLGRTINFAAGGNGAPTGAGATAKAALILAGNSVNTN